MSNLHFNKFQTFLNIISSSYRPLERSRLDDGYDDDDNNDDCDYARGDITEKTHRSDPLNYS